MANLTTIEKLIDMAGELTASEIMSYKQGKELLDIIKANGIEVSEEDLLLEVAQKLSQNIGVGMKLLLKIDEALVDGLIKAIEETTAEEVENKKGEDEMTKPTNNKNTNGGKEMEGLNTTKLAGFKAMGLEGLYKMAAFNTGLMSDPEFLAAIAELQGQTVMSQKAEGTNADNNKGGTNMENKETKQAETKAEETTKTETEGGAMKEGTTATNAATGIFGVKHQLQILNNKKYFDLLATVAEKLGAKGLEKIDETGTKLAVVAVKEAGTLKELIYRIATVAAVEWVKSQVDNDFVELIGSTIQGYQVLRIGGNIYKLYKTFDEVSRKDINDLEELLERLMAERDARRQQGKKVPNMAM